MIVSEAQGNKEVLSYLCMILKTLDYHLLSKLIKFNCLLEVFLYFDFLSKSIRKHKRLMDILSFWQIQYIVVSYWTWASAAAFSEQHKDDDEGDLALMGKQWQTNCFFFLQSKTKQSTFVKWFIFLHHLKNNSKTGKSLYNRNLSGHVSRQRQTYYLQTCLVNPTTLLKFRVCFFTIYLWTKY